MLLGRSGASKGMEVGYEAVNGSELGDGGVEHGALLARLVEAMWEGDPARTAEARTAVAEAAGADVMVDAVAVSANFHMMTRIADATGTPMDAGGLARVSTVSEACDLDGFVSKREAGDER